MRSIRYVVPVLALAGLVACDRSPSGMNQGRLTIQLTDAPGDLEEAWVRIDRVVLLGAEGEGARHELQPQHDYINLLTLSGGQVMDLVSATLPTGTYSELRLVLGDAYVRLNDGRVFATSGATLPAGTSRDGTLRCPSCAQSGFKVKFMGDDMRVEDETTVLIDFDVAQSFGHEAGASGQWIMRPVLRATTRTIRLGSISGDVALADGVSIPACGGEAGSVTVFRPTAVLGTDTATAAVDAEGAFRFSHLLPGTYTMGSLPHVTWTNGDSLFISATATPATVTLPEGGSETANYEITAATCKVANGG